MLRILWCSDAIWSQSGYGVETRLTVPRLAALGYDIALLSTFGLHGSKMTWAPGALASFTSDKEQLRALNGLPVYPGGADPFANDVIGQAARDWKADVVITLKDTFVFKPEAFQGLRWCPLVPCDHEPPPPTVIELARHCYRPIAYAPNGLAQLRAAGLDPLYAPHGYDPAIFYPEPRAEARKALGLPDDLFLVGTVAVNRGGVPSRKAWPQNLEAFARFAADKPHARYFIHTNLAQDGFEGGINLSALCGQLGILDKVIYCDQEAYKAGFPDEYLRHYYNAIDVLNAVSVGEGFGIPQLEAQACAAPIIASEFAAARDLCWGGWFVPDVEGARLKFYDGQGAWIFLPEPAAVAAQLEQAYTALSCPDERAARKALALNGAIPYQIDRVVADYWVPVLAELEEQIATEHARGVLRIVRRQEVGV